MEVAQEPTIEHESNPAKKRQKKNPKPQKMGETAQKQE
jgi:hypothetical protein